MNAPVRTAPERSEEGGLCVGFVMTPKARFSGVTQRRTWGRAFAGVVLVAAAGAVVFAQSPARGSLSGKLTDLHSKPLDGTTLVLRNVATGSEARTTSGKNGSYRFMELEPGEYSLEAANPELGHGQLRGILISAGHEARIQAAVELERMPLESLVRQVPAGHVVVRSSGHSPSCGDRRPGFRRFIRPAPDLPRPTAEKPSTVSPTWEGRLDPEPAGILTLAAISPTEPMRKVRPTETAAASTSDAAPEKAAAPQLPPESVPHGEAEVSLLALGVPVASPASIQCRHTGYVFWRVSLPGGGDSDIAGAARRGDGLCRCSALWCAGYRAVAAGVSAAGTHSFPHDRAGVDSADRPACRASNCRRFHSRAAIGRISYWTPRSAVADKEKIHRIRHRSRNGRPSPSRWTGPAPDWLLEAGAAAPCAPLP